MFAAIKKWSKKREDSCIESFKVPCYNVEQIDNGC